MLDSIESDAAVLNAALAHVRHVAGSGGKQEDLEAVPVVAYLLSL